MYSQSARTVATTMRALAQNPSLRKEMLDLLPQCNTTSSVTAAGAFAAASSRSAAAAGMQAATATARSIPAVRLMSTTTNMNMNMVKSRPNTFFKEEQSLNAPRRPKSSIDMTAADRQTSPYTSMPKPQARTMMSVMSSTSTTPSTSTSTMTSTATAMSTPSTKKSEVFRTQRPGFYSVSAIVRDYSTAATSAPTKQPASKTSYSKVMQTTRPGFYSLSPFVRSFSTTTRSKEFFVGINADWPAEQTPPTSSTSSTTTDANVTKVQKTDKIDLPEEQPTWRPVDDGKVLSESEARIPQNESERYVSALP